MATTALLVGTFSVLLVVEYGFNAFFLFLGSRWARIPNVTFRRALWATIVVVAVNLLALLPIAILDRVHVSDLWQSILIAAMQLAILLGLMWWAIAKVFKTSLWRATLAWLPTLIPEVGFALIAAFGIRPYLFEAFKIPTNAMAPTIIGQHWEAPCPRCGSPAFSGPEPNRGMPFQNPVLMICSRELRSCEIANPPREEHPGDRLVVNKLLCPKRWDIIVFRWPENAEINYCFRLIGLPGETVVIRNGSVWINGEKKTPPDCCKGIEYLDHIERWSGALWGSEAQPARLGPDEYFVLGDFSSRSKDSRLWQQGAPGHPPYAVPSSHIIGVATHIYWPPERWRIFR